MKSINEIMPAAIDEARNYKADRIKLDPLCSELVEKVFVIFALICRGFDQFYADRNRLNSEKIQWVLAFTRLGLRNLSQIQPALNKLALYKYPNPPQLGEFLEWRYAKPEDLGFPSVDEAYQMSIRLNQQFSDFEICDLRVETVIRHAINQIDALTYRHMPVTQAKSAFEYNYTIALQQFNAGKIKVIKKAITEKSAEHPSDKLRFQKAKLKGMSKLKKILNISDKNEK